jgi:hypothetical protein
VKRFFVVTVGLAATFGLMSSCADAPKLTLPTGQTAPDVTLPDVTSPDVTSPNLSVPNLSVPSLSVPNLSVPGVTLPAISLPTDFTVPQDIIDLMIKQFQDAGMNVDRACFSNLLSDESVRKLVSSSGAGSPSPELIQKFLTCITP